MAREHTGFTVEIREVTAPATFNRLPAALGALWESLRALPLGWEQFDAASYVLGPGSVERVERTLARDGELSLTFTLKGCSHTVSVRPATVGGDR
ncbi:hypothetical protein [Kitasatospora sp. MAP5-34]|uniref:hypothetical protein n=1 Tax=Kitasatospora sp. MAP5-34 TaxID=3035102 RepID=UPI0024768BE2|nr:hypothetical protein [Kitasatospora sp. MAP5-34]MDH6579223.1 hypothetical protein [Kitasatospora sp. MAP5-34]